MAACCFASSGVSFMDAELAAVRVGRNRRPAARRHDCRLKGERHFVMSEMLDCHVEVFHFQHQVRTVARRLHRKRANGPGPSRDRR